MISHVETKVEPAEANKTAIGQVDKNETKPA